MTTPLMQLLAECRRSGDPAPLAAAVPYARTMGVSLVLQAGELLGVLRYGEHLIGNPMLPALHGGAISALLESTAIFQLLWEVDLEAPPKTINLTVEYLRSGRPVETYARGRTTRQGRRVSNVRVEAWQTDRSRPIAVATAHLLLRSEDPTPLE